VWHCDNDPGAQRVLAHHWPNVPNLGDITVVDWAQVEPVDIICGGSPCQDVSSAGRRAGMRPGTRSGLWESMREGIAVIRPQLVIWENVRGVTSAQAHSDLVARSGLLGPPDRGSYLRAIGRVLGDLSSLGYDTAWCGLRASDIGAPHGRFRVFILAWPATDTGGEHGQQRRVAAPGQTPGRWSLSELARRGGARLAADTEGNTGWVSNRDTGAATDAECCGRDGRPCVEVGQPVERAAAAGDREDAGAATDADGDGQRGVGWQHPQRCDADRRGGPHSDGHQDQPETQWGIYAPAINRWGRVLGRPAPAPTLPTGRAGGPQLSARFDEWLMGLPDGHVTDPAIWAGMRPSTARNAQLKLCGNGCVPQQAEAAVRHRMNTLDDNLLQRGDRMTAGYQGVPRRESQLPVPVRLPDRPERNPPHPQTTPASAVGQH